MIAFITVANLFAAVHLVQDIITNNKLFASNATAMLATGGVIWATNVIRTRSRTFRRPSADDRRDVPPVLGLTGKAL